MASSKSEKGLSVKCTSKFEATRPLLIRIEEAVYAGMEVIRSATNVRILQAEDTWAIVGYDWPDGEPYYMDTDTVMAPFGLRLVKNWKPDPQERLG